MGATLALSVAAELGSRVSRVVALNTFDYPQGVERANLPASMAIKMMRIPVFGRIPSKIENAMEPDAYSGRYRPLRLSRAAGSGGALTDRSGEQGRGLNGC